MSLSIHRCCKRGCTCWFPLSPSLSCWSFRFKSLGGPLVSHVYFDLQWSIFCKPFIFPLIDICIGVVGHMLIPFHELYHAHAHVQIKPSTCVTSTVYVLRPETDNLPGGINLHKTVTWRKTPTITHLMFTWTFLIYRPSHLHCNVHL